MFMKIFLGLILIVAFLMLYSPFMSLWTDNVSGLNRLMADTANVSELEASFWGLWPLIFLVLGLGGIIWLMVRDR
jgi:hypothetical protein